MTSHGSRADRTHQLESTLAGLAEELDSVDTDLVAFRADRQNAADDDEHDPDGMPLSSVWQRLVGRKERILADVRDAETAVRNLAAGTYGVCEICSLPISQARLEIRPTARRCVVCADLHV